MTNVHRKSPFADCYWRYCPFFGFRTYILMININLKRKLNLFERWGFPLLLGWEFYPILFISFPFLWVAIRDLDLTAYLITVTDSPCFISIFLYLVSTNIPNKEELLCGEVCLINPGGQPRSQGWWLCLRRSSKPKWRSMILSVKSLNTPRSVSFLHVMFELVFLLNLISI